MKKVIVLVIVTLLYLSCITITNTNLTVDATSEEEINLDYQYIYNIIYNLSNVINWAYDEGELQKGRAFGTKGEEYARDKIVNSKEEVIRLSDLGFSCQPIGRSEWLMRKKTIGANRMFNI